MFRVAEFVCEAWQKKEDFLQKKKKEERIFPTGSRSAFM
jgi:hypothetical protein